MGSRQRSVVVSAEPDAIWAVLADFGQIADWVLFIEHSRLLSTSELGPETVRRVQIGRQTLIERVTQWEPPHALAYLIEGLPPLIGTVHNTWTLRPAGRVTEVTLTTAIDGGTNPLTRIVAGRVLDRLATGSEVMLAGLAARVGDTSTTGGAPTVPTEQDLRTEATP